MSGRDAPPLEGLPPVEPRAARVLILGSMPGAASLDAARYYAHPRNAFWPILLDALEPPAPGAPDDPRLRARALDPSAREALLHRHGIALWDVIHRCQRRGSLDTAIDPASVVVNPIGTLLARQPGIRRILFNGTAAEQLFRRHVEPDLDAAAFPPGIRLPSTSPANASMTFERKRAVWTEALRAPVEALDAERGRV